MMAAPPISPTACPELVEFDLVHYIALRGLDDRIGAGNPRVGRRAHHPVHEASIFLPQAQGSELTMEQAVPT